MKKMTKAARPARTKSYLKHKLISAGAMLLVSAIMMVSTSYAWYVLSTAPEVSNIKTQVGANGALEIALLNEESWADLNLLDMGDIDESAPDQGDVAATVANLTWGNLVNLDDSSYGLDKIILNPARLYIEQDGTDYKVNSILLKTPIYGEDGRVEGLDKTSAVAWSYANGTFSNATGYGVRAIGTSATMSVFQLGMNAARSSLVTYSSSARTNASNTLQATGGSLAGIVVDYAVSSKTTGFTKADVANIKELAVGLQSALEEIETALRQVFAGYITTTSAVDEGVTSTNYQAKLDEINDPAVTIATLRAAYPGIAVVVAGIDDYIDKLAENQTKVENAIANCDTMLNGAEESFTWTQLAGVIYPLVDTDAMLVNGKNIETLKSELMGEGGAINFDAALALVSGGITITVPSQSGLLSDIADFAGDYTATVPVTVNATIGGNALNTSMDVIMTTATSYNPTHLTASGNGLKAATVAEATGSNSITDYYGYAIDLAFRTNAVDSSLLLQTEAANRIYDGDSTNPNLQGGGSYMSFTTSAGLSATKMVKLMSGIRVVLMDGNQKILGIAALDTALGKDVYVVLDDETKAETGMYAYLSGSAGAYQNSDLIDAATYNALPDTSNVTFNPTTGKVTAKLYIYDFEMTKSTTVDENGNTVDRVDEDGKTLYTGGLTLKEKVSDGVITELLQDVVQKVTALVYLDGSVVNNSTVAANSMHSMTGTLNLQFSSSAELLPADNTALRTDTSGVTYDELTGELYEAGYLNYGGVFGKITDGYGIYTDSNDKIYFAQDGSDEYTELTIENVSTVLTPLTVTMTNTDTGEVIGDTLELNESEVVNFSVALDTSVFTNLEIYQTGSSTVSNSVATLTLDHATLTGTVTATAVGSADLNLSLTLKVKPEDGGSGSAAYGVDAKTITVTVSVATGEGS